MHEPLGHQIGRRLSDFVDGRTCLQDFRKWFVPLSITIEESGDDAATALAHEIDGLLAEASSAGWTEEDLKEELASLGQPFASRERAIICWTAQPATHYELFLSETPRVTLHPSIRKGPKVAYQMEETREGLELVYGSRATEGVA